MSENEQVGKSEGEGGGSQERGTREGDGQSWIRTGINLRGAQLPKYVDAAGKEDSSATRTRLNVPVWPEAIEALELVMEREGVTMTEAVSRLLKYGGFLYREVKVEGATVTLEKDGETKDVVFI